MFRLIIILLLAALAFSQIQSIDTLVVARQTFTNSGVKIRSSTNNTFTINWPTAINGSVGPSAACFEGTDMSGYSFYLSFLLVTYNESNTAISVDFLVVDYSSTYRTQFVKVRVNAFMLYGDWQNKFQLSVQDVSPSVLNTPNPVNSTYSQTFYLVSRFNLTADYKVYVFFSSFRLYADRFNEQRLSFNTVQAYNSSHVDVTIQTTDKHQNYLTGATFAMIIVEPSLINTTNFYEFQGIYSSNNPSNQVYKSFNLSAPSTFHQSIDVSLCITSFFHLSVNPFSAAHIFFFLILSTDTFTVQNNHNTLNYYTISVTCFVQCTTGYRRQPGTSDFQCQNCGTARQPGYLQSEGNQTQCYYPCSHFIDNCRLCDNRTYCTSCLVGTLVQGGCTMIDGCSRIIQSSQNTAVCLECESSQFVLENGNCVCPTNYFLVTGHCTNVYGCILTFKNSTSTVCAACNTSAGFVLANQQCICLQGYEMANQTCLQICGDGLIFDLPCDDGNLVDGDGCDSQCSVEQNWSCSYDFTASNGSSCTYAAKISFQVLWIDNTGTENQGVLCLEPSLVVETLSLVNFTQNVVFVVQEYQVPITSHIYTPQQLLIYFSYQMTLENKVGNVSIWLDPSHFSYDQNNTLSFDIVSQQLELFYEQSFQQEANMKLFLFWASISAYIILGLSLFVHKMLGVQVLTTLQIIYLLHNQTSNQTSVLTVLKALTLTTGNFLYQTRNYNSNIYLTRHYQLIEFSQQNRQFSMTILAAVSGCLMMIWVIVRVIDIGIVKLGRDKLKAIESKLFEVVFTYTVAFVIIIFIFTSDIASGSSSSTEKLPSQKDAITNIFLAMTAGIVIAAQALHKPIDTSNSQRSYVYPSDSYVKAFLFFIILTSLVFATAVLSTDYHWQRYFIFIFSLSLLMHQVKHLPYRHNLHNSGVILHSILLIIFGAYLCLREVFSILVDISVEIILMAVILGLMFVSIVIDFVRLINILYLSIKATFCHDDKEETLIQTNFLSSHKEEFMKRPLVDEYRQNLIGDSYWLSSMNQALNRRYFGMARRICHYKQEGECQDQQ